MGQKANPIGLRIGFNLGQEASAGWFPGHGEYAKLLSEDLKIRHLLQKMCGHAGVSKVKIDRPGNQMNVTLICARPGNIIGKKGHDIEEIRNRLVSAIGRSVHLTVTELKRPDLDAKIVAEGVAQQIEKRVLFRKAMKKAIQQVRKAGALGIKVMVSGRLGGAEIARSEVYKEGRVPLQTFRADIDYALALARTTYGVIGVKIWIYKGDSQKNKPSRNERSVS